MTLFVVITFFVSFGIKDYLEIESIFFFCVFVIINIIQVYVYLRHQIKFYNSLQIREKKKIEQSSLVGQLLPPHVPFIFLKFFIL